MPETVLTAYKEKTPDKKLPAATAMKLFKITADKTAETTVRTLNRAAKAVAASCVLSPISAANIIKKEARKDSIYFWSSSFFDCRLPDCVSSQLISR